MTPRLGLRANAAQFTLLVAVNALVGGLLGSERTVLSPLAERDFRLAAYTAALTYILAFGAIKALTNFFAGTLSDRYGRKPVLVAGWLAGIPVPLMIIWAPSWGWVVAANLLLGVNQGLAWSTTVIMKIDLAGPARRGLAMGLNEAAGYLAVAGTAAVTGALATEYGLRPAPFLLALAYAALGLGLSVGFVRETHDHARHEAANHSGGPPPSTRQIAALVSYREPALASAAHAGMVNNLNDGLAWGLFPLLFVTAGLPLSQIGVLAALYPAVWGLGQLATGPLSDRYGRKPFIVAGMLIQGAALAWIAAASGFPAWASAAVLLGVGTAMVYPTLLAAVGDVAHPAWRARAVGVYRLWRDGGFAIGAVMAGILADTYGIRAATAVVAALTAGAGVLVWVRMYETHRRSFRIPERSRRPGRRTVRNGHRFHGVESMRQQPAALLPAQSVHRDNGGVELVARTHPAYRRWLDSVTDDVALVDGVLYSRDTLPERNDTFEVAEYAPGHLLIGQGGAGGFVLPADGRPGPVYRVDLGSMCEDDFEPIAETFEEWEEAGFPVPGDLTRDPGGTV